MKRIPLTQNQFALVDDEDYERVNKHKWWVTRVKNRLYAMRHIRPEKGKYRKELLHRFVMQANPGQQVDHINGDGLNCTRDNLRYATNAENNQNKNKPKNNTSGYKGIDWMKQKNKWRAKICVRGQHIHIGLFDDPIAAAHAYDEAARKHHGAFARTNF